MSDTPLTNLSTALAGAMAAAAPSVVAVRSHRSASSGLVWRPDLVVTSDEALAEEGGVSVILPGGVLRAATIVGRDATTAIALLRIEGGGLTSATLDAGPIQAGAVALAIGSQDNGTPVAAFGIVALAGAPWLSMRGGEIDARIELDLRMRRHAQGGLVIDAAGRGIGMAVFGPRRRVVVIPTATIERVATRLAAHGRIAHGYLGLGMQPVALDGMPGAGVPGAGVMVMAVDAQGPAAAAGLRQGDVIVAWNGIPLGTGIRALLRALGPDSIGTTVTLSLRRGGEPIELQVTVAERAAG